MLYLEIGFIFPSKIQETPQLMAAEKQLYKVTFTTQDQIYEVYAKEVYQSDLYGFVVIEGLVFGETSGIVVDPSEEKLKVEFEGVKRSFIPMHEIIRIDEVERRGTAKIRPTSSSEANSTSNVTNLYHPDNK